MFIVNKRFYILDYDLGRKYRNIDVACHMCLHPVWTKVPNDVHTPQYMDLCTYHTVDDHIIRTTTENFEVSFLHFQW